MSSPKVYGEYSDYNSEFEYADEIEPELAKIMAQVEAGPRHEKTSAQTFETWHQKHEENVDSRKQYRWAQQDELKSERTGRILHMNVFLGKLKEAGLNCWYTEKGGMKGTLGLYVARDGVADYICFVQVPLMQEYEEVHFDAYDVPLGSKRRGWRTVLLRLMEKKYLTEAQANQYFGEPASGPVSRRYRQYLAYLRNLPQ